MPIYASETWKSNNNLAPKLDVFHHRCLWKLLKISWKDHVTIDDVRQRSGQRKLSEIMKEHWRIKWRAVVAQCSNRNWRN